jgi:hypothetical protein
MEDKQMLNNNSYFQSFDNITFSDLWSTKEAFIKDYNEIGFPKTDYQLDDETLQLIWLLLIGRFADSVIKPYNTYGAFKVRFMSRVWQHAPAWKKNLDIQNKLRSLSLEEGSEIYEGGKAIYNSAMNPGTRGEVNEAGELNFINSQNTTKHKKSKLEGLAFLSDLLKNDITEQFLRRFDDLFKTIIYSGRTLLYSEGDEQ